MPEDLILLLVLSFPAKAPQLWNVALKMKLNCMFVNKIKLTSAEE